jgi:hypothetical protein
MTGEPDPYIAYRISSAVVVHVALIACDRQGLGAMRFEILKVVVV